MVRDRYSLWRDAGSIRPHISPPGWKALDREKKFTDLMLSAAIAAVFTFQDPGVTS